MENKRKLLTFVAPEIVFGAGAIELAGQYAKNLGAKKVLLVTDPGVGAAGWVTRATDSLTALRIPYVLFDAVTENPKAPEVAAGVALYESAGCNMIVAIGGGSPMDCGKAIGIVASNRRDILQFEGVDRIQKPIPPLVCIPTTAGSSADVSQFCIIADPDRRMKMAIVSKAVVPAAALIDPQTLTSMPPHGVACTGMDALTHAIEAYVSTENSPLTDLHALEAVRLISAHLVEAVKNPASMEHQGPMMLASMEAGLAFSNAVLGAVHALAHSLGGYLNLPHGECNAILLPIIVSYNYEACPERFDRLAGAMGLDLAGCDAVKRSAVLVGKIAELRDRVGISPTIGHLGVTRADVPRLADFALKDACMVTNPRLMEREDVEAISESTI